MRKLLILFVLVGLLVAVDTAVRATAERRVSGALQRALDTEERPQVALGGFPFTVRLLSGSLPVVRVSSPEVVRQRVRLTDVRMRLEDVRFSWSEVVAGEVGSVSMRAGSGRASLGSETVNRALRDAGVAVSLEVRQGRLVVQAGNMRRTLPARLSLEGSDLVVGVRRLGRIATIPLPVFVDGLRYHDIRVDGARAVVRFSLTEARFTEI